MDYKVVIGAVTLILAVISYGFYFRDMFRGTTRPHAFSWFVWALISGIVFVVQMINHAGPGAWLLGFTSLVCLVICVVAAYRRSEPFSKFDAVSLALALLALLLWKLTNSDLSATVLVSLAFALGFLPTFRKGYLHPNSETAKTFALNALKFSLSIAALNSLAPSVWLYPAVVAVLNFAFLLLLLRRRKII